jgi:23S rRNA pseudouridine2605 synthase
MIRLQKFLAEAGIASRRKSEELITAGKIQVNGVVVTELGTKVGPEDRVEYNNEVVSAEEKKIYLALYKPVGYISSTTSSQGASVLDLVETDERVYPVGRLDKDSSGLTILTNDGEFTNKITHPKYESEKEYEVVLNRPMVTGDIKELKSGMMLDDKKLQPVKILDISETKINLILKEGINRQIRRMMGRLGYRVVELKRVRIGKLRLGNMKVGESKKIKPEDI